jgi:hypothetical protein
MCQGRKLCESGKDGQRAKPHLRCRVQDSLSPTPDLMPDWIPKQTKRFVDVKLNEYMSKDRLAAATSPKLRNRFRFRFQNRSSNAWLVSLAVREVPGVTSACPAAAFHMRIDDGDSFHGIRIQSCQIIMIVTTEALI